MPRFFFSTNRIFGVIAGIILTLNSVFAQADTETGYFRVGAIGASWPVADFIILENKTYVPSGTGRCSHNAGYGNFVGNGTLGASFTSSNAEANKALYSMLLAANLAGKQVTVVYSYDSQYTFSCLINSALVN